MKMPFGKYRGMELEGLDDNYLTWLFDLGEGIKEPLKTEVAEEIRIRLRQAVGVREIAQEIVSAGYRSLAQRDHPDHGGDHGRMVELNDANTWLKLRVKSLD